MKKKMELSENGGRMTLELNLDGLEIDLGIRVLFFS